MSSNARHKFLFLFVFHVVLLLYSTSEAKVILVDGVNGKDGPDCIETANSPCLNLMYAVRNTFRDTILMLISPVIFLNTTVEFHDKHNISIIGGNYSSIQCVCIAGENSSCGLKFTKSSNIRLYGFEIQYCSIIFQLTRKRQVVWVLTGLHFDSCRNLNISNVLVKHSNGFGLSLINNQGKIEINKCSFSNNSRIRNYGGGGMLIYENNNLSNQDKGTYMISNCHFCNNFLSQNKSIDNLWYHLTYGGGLNVFFSGNVTKSVKIIHSKFTNNTSFGGGGIAVSFNNGASNNHFLIHGCSFDHNNGSYDKKGGGGGMKIAVNSNSNSNNVDNRINITNCTFIGNKAQFGGGVSVMAGSGSQERNQVNFYECHWLNNTSPISAAVDISPDYRSQDGHIFNTFVRFKNCHIIRNILAPLGKPNFQGNGVFLVSKLNVSFQGHLCFQNNHDTALFIYSSYININSSSVIQFSNNSGSNGGAIRMAGFSGIHYDNNVTLSFVNNSASYLGGAIYSTNIEQHLPFSSHTCLFKPKNNVVTNVSFLFINNRAGTHHGLSIYLTTINACRKACSEAYIHDPFNDSYCFGNFTFKNNTLGEHVTTDVDRLFINYTIKNEQFICEKEIEPESCTFNVIPGFSTYIALRTNDDFDMKTTDIAVFYVNFLHRNFDAYIDTGSRVMNNNHVKIHGNPGDNGTLVLSPVGYRNKVIKVNFTLIDCPPGYVLINESCFCSSLQNDSFHYLGISGCNLVSGLLLPGYWAGYIYDGNGNASDSTLFTSDCPRSYCDYNSEYAVFGGRFLQLSSTASKVELKKQICAKNREGILCGNCTINTSVFYHSNNFKCMEEKYCSFGLVFYVLVDLVPTAILFSVLLSLDISLTSGAAYSVIFMMQQIHVSEITARGAIVFGKYHPAIEVANVIYSFLDLEFLNIEQLSFCLWSGAKTLDTLMIKYVTVVFSMVLVFIFVLSMKKCNCVCIKRFCKRNRPGSHYSVAQGLTAFLIICYNETTRVTFNILSRGVAYSKGSKNKRAVAFLYGESMYFHYPHLFYAIPALLFLIFIVIPPPLILIFDPLLSKLESLSWFRMVRWTRFRMRFKPILDAFQNCFKDNMQWYAGFFFLYRFMVLMISMVSNDTVQYYYIIEGLFILFLTIHSILQPFASTKHNVLASVCFCNLVLINYFTLRIYSLVTTKGYVTETKAYQWIQLWLIYLPIIVGFVWITRFCLKQFSCRRNQNTSDREWDDVEILFDRSISDYNSFKAD